ncbi:cytochrome c [Phenylobacterium sp. J367]|uniref:c-type cytochrome n=1 Tax=Phenylobacterium sp. J367 TaxID=2898435 RepID=UPI002151FA2F|nr:cytochrome c [Phenylobacterium sp. J367]MCR5880532.1 cytochrome c [Phenylobacterium sp. J367]
MRPALIATALMFAATPGLADEPGPGGSKPPVPKTGAEVYRMYCQACHMPDAKGAVGAAAFPALAANPRLGSPQYAMFVVENGKAGMPPFKTALTPEQEAMLITYLRTHFGNDYREPVSVADVEAMRKAAP